MRLLIAVWSVCVFQGGCLRLFNPPEETNSSSDCDGASQHAVSLNKVVMMAQLDNDFTKSKLFKNWFIYAKPYLDDGQVSLVFDTGDDQKVDAYLKDFDSGGIPLYTMREIECRGLSHFSGANFEKKKTAAKSMGNLTVGPFGSRSYETMMKRRPKVLELFLESGHDVLQFDVDAVWTKNPLTTIEAGGSHDVYVTMDDTGRGDKGVCGCFLYFRQTPGSIAVAKKWISSIRGSDAGNQKGLNRALGNPRRTTLADVYILPREEFASSRTMGKYHNATVMHANFVRGTDAKVDKLKHYGYWKA